MNNITEHISNNCQVGQQNEAGCSRMWNVLKRSSSGTRRTKQHTQLGQEDQSEGIRSFCSGLRAWCAEGGEWPA